jgi:methionine-gamma-lyase
MEKELISNGKKKVLKPETLMMGYGYKPEWSEGAVKCPIFQTSTFVFENAKDGKEFFEMAHGVREPGKHGAGLIYSRINNPDLEILEDRLTVWDEAEACAVFDSGMAAISTTVLELLKPGDVLLSSEPIYGGTEHLFETVLTKFGIKTLEFGVQHTKQQIIEMVERAGAADKLRMIFFETPANPTNCLIDIDMCVDIAKHFSTTERKVLTALDNTFLGPVFQHPIKHGIDLVLYSATKYIGGHSDVVAGACLGSKELINRIKSLRVALGSMASPLTGWLLMRSLETLKMRMTTAALSAEEIAEWLTKHPKVDKVLYLGLLKEGEPQYTIYKKQCLSPGAMISFIIKGDEQASFRFLDSLKMIKLAVSLGGTESLAEHPAAMTHSAVEPQKRKEFGITDNLVRLSVGVEAVEDIIWDLDQALAQI